ncbi:MAG: hypothetical protein GPJ54_10765 [Candidatus Heimdallarchaeota archaeon]|nr:hypothetical protein [Candidatus Heimdallarchaeota archaeon]
MQDTILLLNASNYEENLVYPYAFVQISEIASRYDIKVIRKDLFGIEDWRIELDQLLRNFDFKMVFVTLRNTDTLGIHEYPNSNSSKEGDQNYYFPLDLTKKLIKILKTITEIPIIIGGFGFSVIPKRILNFVEADYGVFGGPEGFFDNFQAILLRNELQDIPNLVYSDSGKIKQGPRTFYPPSENPEYHIEIINEIKQFNSMKEKNDNVATKESVALEISRGCPYRCSFCSEPVVKGSKVQYRKIDTIIADMRILRDNGFYQIFFVCSELNPFGNEFALDLAKRIKVLNSEVSVDKKINWLVTYLMNFTLEEFKFLKTAGFHGGWYDIISLEDDNLLNMSAPYNSVQILDTIQKLDGGLKGAYIEEDDVSIISERIYSDNPKTHRGSFFLGNPRTSISTVRETLVNAHMYRLDLIYDKTGINFATRIFDYIGLNDHELRCAYSIDFGGKLIDYDQLYPSFSYPPDLLDHFQDENRLRNFFTYIQTSFLSSEHRFLIDWQKFLTENIDKDAFSNLWANIKDTSTQYQKPISQVNNYLENFDTQVISDLFSNDMIEEKSNLISASVNNALQTIIYSNINELKPFLQFLQLPTDLDQVLNMSSYELMRFFYTTYQSISEIIEVRNSFGNNSIERLFFEYFIAFKNIKFDEIYRPFFSE